MLPNVKITLGNGGLGQTTQTADGVVGMILTGVSLAAVDKVKINKPYALFSLQEAEALGIKDASTNQFAYNEIKDFYAKAGIGAELWLMLIAEATTLTQALDKDNDFAQKLILASGGRIRILSIAKDAEGTETAANGLDQDVHTAVPKAQALAQQWFTQHRPFRIIIGGNTYTGVATDLKNYKETAFNRVSIFLGNTNNSNSAGVGLLMGRIASNPVQRNVGRVADGSLADINAYFTNKTTSQENELQWEIIHSKGYMFYRSYVGKSGFFVNDDPTLTADTDDYNSLARGRVIDKATLLAYGVFIEKILDEIPFEASGLIHPGIVKSWEAQIETAINAQMVQAGELSGVSATIDPTQDVLASGKVDVVLNVQPVGYAKNIEVFLGFTKTITE